MSDHAREKALRPAAVSPQPEPPRDWLIFDARDRLWWKPLAKGYTPNIDEAGRFTEYQAKGYESFTNDRHDIAIPLPAASQPPAIPVQDALTTLLTTWRDKADRNDTTANMAVFSDLKYGASCWAECRRECADELEAALRREPPAVRTEKD